MYIVNLHEDFESDRTCRNTIFLRRVCHLETSVEGCRFLSFTMATTEVHTANVNCLVNIIYCSGAAFSVAFL